MKNSLLKLLAITAVGLLLVGCGSSGKSKTTVAPTPTPAVVTPTPAVVTPTPAVVTPTPTATPAVPVIDASNILP